MIVIPEVPGVLDVGVGIGLLGPGGSGVSEVGGEPGKGAAVTLWLVDPAVEMDDGGDATVLGDGGGDGWIP
uniref:Uncharacterized protein n=1 Tax=Nelumbo nucifera TaxID=4432 RepID=A0A822YUZ0_NELNU|nr:TPA_asm: hypothetical protein HUJ06_007133 [Nelumbo nucifera]